LAERHNCKDLLRFLMIVILNKIFLVDFLKSTLLKVIPIKK